MTITIKQAIEHPEWISGKFLKVSNLITPTPYDYSYEKYYSPTEYIVKNNRLFASSECTFLQFINYFNGKKLPSIKKDTVELPDFTSSSEKVKIETFITIITKEEFEEVLNQAYQLFINYE